MSRWATLEAQFELGEDMDWAIHESLPTGSESGPSVHHVNGEWFVSGRLRGAEDETDAAAILAWFCGVTRWADGATLTMDFDGGPKYRYVWSKAEGLRKLKGILDL